MAVFASYPSDGGGERKETPWVQIHPMSCID